MKFKLSYATKDGKKYYANEGKTISIIISQGCIVVGPATSPANGFGAGKNLDEAFFESEKSFENSIEMYEQMLINIRTLRREGAEFEQE